MAQHTSGAGTPSATSCIRAEEEAEQKQPSKSSTKRSRSGSARTHVQADSNVDLDHPEMDSSLWKDLPEDIFLRVLCCLPTAPLFRSCAVSRACTNLPAHPLFQALHSSIGPKEAWFLLLASRHERPPVFAFFPQNNRWSALSRSFLPFSQELGCYPYCLGSTRGLLCCSHWGIDSAGRKQDSIWVGNPLTQKWKCLPSTTGSFPRYRRSGFACIVALDHSTGTRAAYKVIVRTEAGGLATLIEEYDSRRNQWTTTAANSTLIAGTTMEQVVHCNGTLYFLTKDMQSGIHAYSLKYKTWERIAEPSELSFPCHRLVECSGELVLVGGFGRLAGSTVQQYLTTGVHVWLLRNSSPSASTSVTRMRPWTFLCSMPCAMVHEFLTGGEFKCMSLGNLIYLTNSAGMFVLDVTTRWWARNMTAQLPPTFIEGMAFVPNLEASP